MTRKYTSPTSETRKELLAIFGEKDRLVRDRERKTITSLSRSHTWCLEKKELHPARIKLGNNSVSWLLSDLLWFIYRQSNANSTKSS